MAADAKTVPLSVKVSASDAERIDAARGELSRSAWLQNAIGVALGTAPLSSLHPGAGLSVSFVSPRLTDPADCPTGDSSPAPGASPARPSSRSARPPRGRPGSGARP